MPFPIAPIDRREKPHSLDPVSRTNPSIRLAPGVQALQQMLKSNKK